jgi:hypothetical protein
VHVIESTTAHFHERGVIVSTAPLIKNIFRPCFIMWANDQFWFGIYTVPFVGMYIRVGDAFDV